MLSAKDFVAAWGKDGTLIRFGKQTVERLALAEEDKRFLVLAGLPASAAPFLNFEAPKSGELRTVADAWHQPAEFRRYRVIGVDGSGNPIAIDEERSGEVVCLDHEEKFARTFMNKTIRQLAESLLAYRKTWDSVAARGEKDSDEEIPPDACKKLFRELKKIDPAAVKTGGFWAEEVKISDAKAAYPAKVLLDLRSSNPSVRLSASRHLQSELRKSVNQQRKEQFGNRQATTPLMAALDDPEPEVAQNALIALAQISKAYFKDDRAYGKVISLMRSDHGFTHGWAICAAIRLREEASLDDVLPLCADPSEKLRERVFFELFRWLMETKRGRSAGLRPENRERLQQAALLALEDPKAEVRGSAADLLCEIGDADALAAIRARLKKERNRDTKESIKQALAMVEKRS